MAQVGRPKAQHTIEREKMKQLLIERLKEEWVPIVDKAIEQAKAGDKSARQWLSDHGVGIPRYINDEGEEFVPVQIVLKNGNQGD